MSSFALGVASQADWREAADRCAAQINAAPGEPPDLGFLYVTDHLAPHFGSIADRLRTATGVGQCR